MKNWLSDFLNACKAEFFFRLWTWKVDREMNKYRKQHSRSKTTQGHP